MTTATRPRTARATAGAAAVAEEEAAVVERVLLM
ncbi:unnamed protein product [Linum tenue]|uniref:Uncharacterized protein n=1 Tax=Linum tenue TaxID=586396 RepID=A0AAV0QB88_9ROSI|nr:unnamed protein product [Linum tenue]